MRAKRGISGESSHWPAGPFKIRLPFWHYRFEWPDYIQGLLMCAVDLAAIPLMTELLGMPFDVAMAVVLLNGLLYLTHHLLGDPVVPGWITPAIPLLYSYCESFAPGTERIHALIAFQLTLGILCFTLGMSGLSHRVVRMLPAAIKSGIIVGAGVSAITVVFEAGGRFDSFPVTVSLVAALSFYLVFSEHFSAVKASHPMLRTLGNLGIFPVIVLAIPVAALSGEATWPTIEWGFTSPDFGGLWAEYTVFGIGFPPFAMFLTGLPTAMAAYIVLFGDVLQSRAILAEADEERQDELVDYSPDRAHLIVGLRNSLMSVIGPDVAMCGPLWAAMHVVTVERFKQGREAMDSIFGGAGSFRWGTNTGLLLLPVVTLVQPILGVALAITLLIQGFVSVRVGVMEARGHRDLGIAGVVAAVLVAKGAAWAFAVGLPLTMLIYGRDFLDNKEMIWK